jgi:hypothetical protein
MDAAQLRTEAAMCRVLATSFANQTTVAMLRKMAAEFEKVASQRENCQQFARRRS